MGGWPLRFVAVSLGFGLFISPWLVYAMAKAMLSIGFGHRGEGRRLAHSRDPTAMVLWFVVCGFVVLWFCDFVVLRFCGRSCGLVCLRGYKPCHLPTVSAICQ